MESRLKALVAVVDDDRAILESLSDLMASEGYDALEFRSAKELLAYPDIHTIACLISDIRMPGMDGWQLLSILRKHHPQLPVILITAHPFAAPGQD
jgi:FixJ family two-component response regulator